MATKKRATSGLVELSSDNDWRARQDLETMLECERIEADPKRLKAAQALAKKRMMDMAKVASESADES